MNIKNNETELACNIYGAGTTTLLFVHGSNIDQSYFSNQVDYFKSLCRVVTFDLPGHGKSGNQRSVWSLENYATDVRTVIEKLDLQNVILVGHSMGAYINLITATTNRASVLGFVGIDIMKKAGAALPEQIKKSTMENLKADYKGTNEMYVRNALAKPETSPEILNRVVGDYRKSYEPMGIQIMPQILNFSELDKERLPMLNTRLYLINVRYAPTDTSLLEKYVGKNYELHEINGTCHFPMLENPRELNETLAAVIQKIEHVEIDKAHVVSNDF